MPLRFDFDFKNPNYIKAFQHRAARLETLRSDPELLSGAISFYKDNPAQFIIDWGCTFDPKLASIGQPTIVPFLLYPKQEEWVHWLIDCYTQKKRGFTVKCRQMGFSWLLVAVSASLCMFNSGFNIGLGSKRADDIDSSNNPKSLLYKARLFIEHCPSEFTSGWDRKNPNCTKHMMIQFTHTGSRITGDSGDHLGRGGTYFPFYGVDEAAFLERPHLAEDSLSQATTCRIDISTPNGMSNPFAEKIHSGKHQVFRAPWSDDPTKDLEWYKKQEYELDAVTLAQEINCDFSGSVIGILIPREWVLAAVDAHIKLGFDMTGHRVASFDVADEGSDMNAVCIAKSSVIDQIFEWTGKSSDIYASVEKAIGMCEMESVMDMIYDADGVGAGVKGDAKRILAERSSKLNMTAFRGGSSVVDPDREIIEGSLNKDIFENLKAQSYWLLRKRFQLTYRAITDGIESDPGEMISIRSGSKECNKLIVELSRPTYTKTNRGKIIVDKNPNGSKSPNLADAVMMAFAPKQIRRSYWTC